MSEGRERPKPETLPSEAGAPADARPPADTPSDEPAPDGAARPSVAPRSLGWRDEAAGTAYVTLIAGVWLIFSPEALGYAPSDAVWNPLVGGILAVILSGGRILAPRRERTIALLLFVLGAWLAVSSFLFDAPIQGQWNQGGFGGIIALLSLVGLAGSQRGRELNRT